MKQEPIKLEGHCYVLLQGDWIHPIAYRRHELLWYPERGMPLFEQVNYRPYVQSVVTECPWIVAMYDYEKVRIVDEDGRWRCPNMQTYCSDASNILHGIMDLRHMIPAQAMDGGEKIKQVIADYAKRVKKAANRKHPD